MLFSYYKSHATRSQFSFQVSVFVALSVFAVRIPRLEWRLFNLLIMCFNLLSIFSWCLATCWRKLIWYYCQIVFDNLKLQIIIVIKMYHKTYSLLTGRLRSSETRSLISNCVRSSWAAIIPTSAILVSSFRIVESWLWSLMKPAIALKLKQWNW